MALCAQISHYKIMMYLIILGIFQPVFLVVEFQFMQTSQFIKFTT